MSFRAIYDAHFHFVWRVVRRLGVSEADAQDAVQDVFIVVHRRLGEFSGEAKVTTWLYEICIRVAKERSRKSSRLQRLLWRFADSFRARSVEDASVPHERRELLEYLMGKMSEPLRTAFVLFELEELSADEIAVMVRVPVGTVRSRLRLARASFERELQQLSLSAEENDRVQVIT